MAKGTPLFSVVALIKPNGTMRYSKKRRVGEDGGVASAKAEAERLAREHPGIQYAALAVVKIVKASPKDGQETVLLPNEPLPLD